MIRWVLCIFSLLISFISILSFILFGLILSAVGITSEMLALAKNINVHSIHSCGTYGRFWVGFSMVDVWCLCICDTSCTLWWAVPWWFYLGSAGVWGLVAHAACLVQYIKLSVLFPLVPLVQMRWHEGGDSCIAFFVKQTWLLGIKYFWEISWRCKLLIGYMLTRESAWCCSL